MRWALINTNIDNPGDVFARVGVQKLIQSVDDYPVFEVLDKNDHSSNVRTRCVDKIVLCGMPLFWSMPGNECQDIHWWETLIRGWPTREKRNFMVVGAGHVFTNAIHNFTKYTSAIDEIVNLAWAVTVREPIIDHPRIIDSICPSSFCLRGQVRTRSKRFCNLMSKGGHFGYASAQEFKIWKNMEPAISAALIGGGFIFVAHDKAETLHALKLGWPEERIFQFDTVQGYLNNYQDAACYFGNRLHGAAVCASIDAPTWAVTYDSRLGMVKRLGGRGQLPSEVNLENLLEWIQNPTPVGRKSFCVEEEFQTLSALMRKFANG